MSSPSQLPAGNISLVSAGTGIVSIGAPGEFGGSDFGYISGDLNFQGKLGTLPVKVGRPRQRVGSIPIDLDGTMEVGSLQLSAATFSHMLGEQPITAAGGSPVTVTMQPYTMATFPLDNSFQAVFIGPNLSTGGSKPVVKNEAESTTYTEGTDYLVDYINGWIILEPAGAITDGETLHITATSTPVATNTVDLGISAQLSGVSLLLTHYRPNGDYTKIWFPIAESDQGIANIVFKEDGLIVPKMKWSAIRDPINFPDLPLIRYIESRANG